MTNINCALNCAYQQDGKCDLNNIAAAVQSVAVTNQALDENNSCLYYTQKFKNANKQKSNH